MWGTDFTTTHTAEDGQVAVFIAVDHCTTEGIGIHASKHANRFEALEPIRQGVRARFGGFHPGVAQGLKLRHDHGTQYVADAFQKEIRWLGIEPSPAFVRAPEGNGCAERFIRTLKEQLLWVRRFRNVEELQAALSDWLVKYNEKWLVQRHGYRTPAQVRQELLAVQAAA
jgi:transposase InsO family protein